jgi:hypothetical protein
MVLGGWTAWAANVAQGYFAPWVIFPVLVGLGLGAMLVGLTRINQVGHRPTIVLAALLAALVAVAGQHYADYRAAYRRACQENEVYRLAVATFPQGIQGRVPAPPASFADYLLSQAAAGREIGAYRATGWMVWLSWTLDGLLLPAAMLALMTPALRQPYCNRCRSWFRVVRSGRIDAATARQMAELAAVATVEKPVAARYRLLNCNAHCGPTGFELSWDESPRGTTTLRTWLAPDVRNRIHELLDAADTDTDTQSPIPNP